MDVERRAPAYRQIEEDLRERVRQGVWPVGGILPSRQALAHDYEVDLTTLQKAIAPLLDDGTLRAEKGRGTFVAEGVDRKVASPPAPTIGILCQPDDGAWYWNRIIVDAIERTVSENGGLTRFLPLIESRLDPTLLETTDALALIDIHGIHTESVQQLALGGSPSLPTLLITYRAVSYPMPHLIYDQQLAGFQAAQHLLAQGWPQLLFFAPFEASWAEERLKGAQEAVRLLGEGADVQICPGESVRRSGVYGYEHEDGLRAGRLLLKDLMVGPVGIIAANDRLARGLWQVLREAGRREFGLVGFDDDPESRTSGLTSLRPPLEDMGSEAARQLLRALNGKPLIHQMRLASHLVSRASSQWRRK